MSEAPALDTGVEYPTRDGRPVAETPLHYRRLADAAHALTMRFEARPDAYVGVNMLVYDERGNPRRHLSPDVFVAFGVEDRERDIYKLWEDESPAFVLEVTSKTTRREDRRKKARYARWGVAEYFLYDPRGEYLKPALLGFELSGTTYRAMQTTILPNGKPGLESKALGLGLWLDDAELRFFDPHSRRNLSTPKEAELGKADAEAARADAAAARAEAQEAKARLAAALAELENRR